MAELTIPENYRSGIVTFGALPADQFSAFFEALKGAPPKRNASDLATLLAYTLPSIEDTSRIAKMITSLLAMQRVCRSSHVEPSEFASDVWDSLMEDSPNLLVDVDEAVLQDRVSRFVNETSIHLTDVRVSELRSEVERAFCTARILTDLRASFGADASRPPDAMTILHTLEIRYHDDGGRHKEFYVSLDDADLGVLKAAIQRAEQKKMTLQSFLEKSDLTLLE